MSTVGDDVTAALEVRGAHAVGSGEMGSEMDTGSWHEGGEELRGYVMESPQIVGPTAAAARV